MNGYWNWTDGSRSIYTNWEKDGNDDVSPRHDCVYLDSDEGKWKDENCTKKLPSLCKMRTDCEYKTRRIVARCLLAKKIFLIANPMGMFLVNIPGARILFVPIQSLLWTILNISSNDWEDRFDKTQSSINFPIFIHNK